MSDVYYVLVRRIEDAIDDRAELDALRVELASTSGLTESEHDSLADRLGRYLADHDRADAL